MRFLYIILSVLLLNLAGCERFVLMNTPSKRPLPSHNPLATQAERYFWQTLHQGNYQNIPRANYLLQAAYLKNPYDPKLAAHLGFIHIWKIAERARVHDKSPLITDHIILSRKYFADSLQLDPKNPVYQGFYGDSQLVEGQIFKDQRQQVKGYFTLKKAIRNWPEFNYFTAGYPMSTLPADSKHFKEGLKWQWKNLDVCAGRKVNRRNPDYSPFMYRETHVGKQRACWNSVMAPYNFEGFFMNMGDMLVKSGDSVTAVRIYQNAKLAKNYFRWPYKAMLEKRILNARANVRNFQQDSNDPDHAVLFNSGYGCVACHQN